MIKKTMIFCIAFLLLPLGVFASQMNSSTYKQNVVVSYGSEDSSSTSYKTILAVGIINAIINSTSYINKLGFFHILLLADSQPCTDASQCEGGYCCSNSCSSSACPSSSTSSTSSGGGGGGASSGGGGGTVNGSALVSKETPQINKNFVVSQTSIKEHMALGETKSQTITVKNTGNVGLDLKLNVLTVDNMVSPSEKSFKLEPNEEKKIELNFIGKNLGSFMGEIEVTSGEVKKSVNVILEIASENALFDVKMDVPHSYQEVEPGGDLKAQITLLNVGPPKKVDVTATYIIKDRFGNSVYESSETFAVEKQTSFLKSLKLPNELKPGNYLAVIEVKYENSFAVSSELFTVVEKGRAGQKIANASTAYIIALFVFGGLLFLFVYMLVPRIRIFGKSK